jgi:hypothetical protein
MEGLSAAASAVAVVGLARQVAQGCSYLQTVFNSAKSAPEDLSILRAEIAIIERTVSSICNEHEYQDALDLCHEALEKLRKVVDKYAETTSCGRYRRWSKRLAMALNVDVIQKHVSRLRTAKGHLLDAHNMLVVPSLR